MSHEPNAITLLDGDSMTIELPRGIGHVEIRTTGTNGPTGHPTIGVDVVSETTRTPAKDGRIYEPRFAHSCGVILVGRPGAKLLEQERMARMFEQVIRQHDRGDHSTCPETCPALAADVPRETGEEQP